MTTANALNILLTPNQLIYATGANDLDGLPTANNGVLITSALGVPSISQTLPFAVQDNITHLGVITSLAAPIPLAFGGTSANLVASNGGIFYSTATQGAILAGTATANQLLMSGASVAPAWSTATYPATTTINQILYSSAANTVTGLASANRGVLTTGATGIPVVTPLSIDGQVLIGSTAGAPAAALLTAGVGISITNGPNSISIAVTGGGATWTDVTSATQTLAVSNGYVTDRGAGVSYLLPASGSLGDEIRVVGKLGLTTITQNAGQQIVISSASSSVGVAGSVVGTNVGDCITLICITAGASTVWRANAIIGNWTFI